MSREVPKGPNEFGRTSFVNPRSGNGMVIVTLQWSGKELVLSIYLPRSKDHRGQLDNENKKDNSGR